MVGKRALAAAALAACLAGLMPAAGSARGRSAAAAAAAGGVQVEIDNFTFGPEVVTVAVGSKVTWVNRDDVPHAVVAVDKSFRSAALDTDESFAFTFTKPGAYPYFCSLHPHMTGKVIVKG